MNPRSPTLLKRFAIVLVIGAALLLWTAARTEPPITGVWQTVDVGPLATRPTLVLGRAGIFQFDESGRGRVRKDAATARWELKDRVLWIIEDGKREKLAEVAAVTPTSLVLCLGDAGVQTFTRVGDAN